MGSKLITNANISERIQEVLDEAGLTPELIVKELKTLIIGDDKAEKNKAIKTAAEIMGLIGRNQIVGAQVNLNSPISEEEQAILDKYIHTNKENVSSTV